MQIVSFGLPLLHFWLVPFEVRLRLLATRRRDSWHLLHAVLFKPRVILVGHQLLLRFLEPILSTTPRSVADPEGKPRVDRQEQIDDVFARAKRVVTKRADRIAHIEARNLPASIAVGQGRATFAAEHVIGVAIHEGADHVGDARQMQVENAVAADSLPSPPHNLIRSGKLFVESAADEKPNPGLPDVHAMFTVRVYVWFAAGVNGSQALWVPTIPLTVLETAWPPVTSQSGPPVGCEVSEIHLAP